MIYIYHEIEPQKPRRGVDRFLFFVREVLGVFARYFLGFLVAAFVLFVFAFVLFFALVVLAASFLVEVFRDIFGSSPARRRVSKGDIIDGDFEVISDKKSDDEE